ncbi:hypothetical protein BKA56DRAFT_678627 [Ilyonectria sp. MPI-CAGE-AT-0026]|nr:hypothetical protein BKA56DRAFT_678627 [Ilyonectria sp. MPI-CAGE-AT-0026]
MAKPGEFTHHQMQTLREAAAILGVSVAAVIACNDGLISPLQSFGEPPSIPPIDNPSVPSLPDLAQFPSFDFSAGSGLGDIGLTSSDTMGLMEADKPKENCKDNKSVSIRYYDMKLIRGYQIGAKVLLAHFHYVNKGNIQFQPSFNWNSPSNRRMAELTDTQIQFIQTFSQTVFQNAQMLQVASTLDNYDTPFWFIS